MKFIRAKQGFLTLLALSTPYLYLFPYGAFSIEKRASEEIEG